MVFSWLQRHLLPRAKSPRRPADKSRSRRLTLEALEDRYLLATAITAIANVNVPISKSLIMPVTATSTSSQPLSYSVTSNNAHFQAQVRSSTNPFLQLTVANFGTMTFELLRDVAPNTVDTIGGLAQAGFYNGLTFHRVIKNFVIQGGDPLGTGGGGPGFTFDDELNTTALFSGNGQLAMANSGKDTNGSQFFITVGQQRPLDLNYTIFGQLVRGFDVLTAINSVNTDSDDKPLAPVVITSAKLIQNTTDAVLTVFANGASAAEVGTITVSAFDGVSTVTKTFKATAVVDKFTTNGPVGQPINDPPVLGPISDMVTPVNTPITFPLTSSDLEGSAVIFSTSNPAPNATVMVSGNMVTVTPAAGFKGTIALTVKVAEAASSPLNRFDTQNIFIAVGDPALNGSGVNISGDPGVALTNVPVATFTDLDPGALASDFSAAINWGDGHLTAGTITFNAGTFTVSGSNTYSHAGSYRIKVDVLDNGRAGAITAASNTAPILITSAGHGLLTGDQISVNGVNGNTAANGPFTVTFVDADTFSLDGSDGTTSLPYGGGGIWVKDNGGARLHVSSIATITPTVAFRLVSSSALEVSGSKGLIEVVLSAPVTQTVTVNYAVTGGSAVNNVNYKLPAGPLTLTFAPGQTVKTIPITILNDPTTNVPKDIQITLSPPAQTTVAHLGLTPVHTFSIVNASVSFNVASSSGQEGATPGLLKVVLSKKLSYPVTVDYTVTGGTATNGTDYVLANNTLTFAPGQTVQTISIGIVNDTLFEKTETVQVTLSNAGNAALGAIKTATYSILNNDPAPTVNFSVTSSTASEGGQANIAVTLSAAAGRTIFVSFAALAGTAKGSGIDYTLNPHLLSFAPGQTSRNLVIPITNDAIYDPNETVKVSITSAVGAIRGSNVTHLLTITDTDAKPTVQFTGPSVFGPEGLSGFLVVTLTPASAVTAKVDYFVTAAGSTATGGGVDYTLTNGTLTFLPGQTSAMIPIALTNDLLDEINESVVISLGNPIEATLGAQSSQSVLITDTDATPAVNFTVIAGSDRESAGTAVVAVSLAAASAQTVTVNYAVTGGTALAGDFTLAGSVLTFAPGQTVAYIPITLLYQPAVETNKTIVISLLSTPAPTNAVLGPRKTFTFTILDDHP